MTILDSTDLVFSRDNTGQVNAGGFNINSYLLKNGESGSYVFNDTDAISLNKTGGGIPIASVSDMFKGLAVPAGLLYLQQTSGNKNISSSKGDIASPGLFDRLLDFASDIPDAKKNTPTRKNKTTSRKRKSKPGRQTRKTRKLTRKTR